jgi:hypothetical protein
MARNRRRSRLRSTACPTRRPMAKATRGGWAGSPSTQDIVIGPLRTRLPRRSAAKVARSRTRQIRPTARSGRQSVAALEAAGLQDGASRPRRHAVPEPVVLGSFPGVRLIRSLHPSPPRGMVSPSAPPLRARRSVSVPLGWRRRASTEAVRWRVLRVDPVGWFLPDRFLAAVTRSFWRNGHGRETGKKPAH